MRIFGLSAKVLSQPLGEELVSINLLGNKMKNIYLSSMLAGAASLIFTIAASAATLTNISGEIRVNTGDGFRVVTESVVVKPGDKIMAGIKASAKVVYSNDIAFNLKSGRIMTVATNKMAKIRSKAMMQEAGVLAAAGFGGGIAPAVVVLAGVAIVGGVAVAVANSSDSPASP